MRKIFTRWFQKSSVNPRATLTFAAVWVVALLAIHLLVPTRTIESRVISPLLFKIRDHLGQSPTLNSKIKIFGIDDMTAARLQRPDMNLEEWSKVLTLIDHSKPKAIIIDGLFSLADAGSSLDGLMALARLKRIETPIYTGLFPSRAPIIARTPYKLLNETYDLTTYVDRSMPLPGSEAEQLEKLPLADFRGSVIYGPNLSLHSVFHNAGHILYGEDEGSYMPFLRVDENKTVPHMMVMPFAKTNFQQDRLFIEGAEVFVAQDGSAPINFPSRDHMYRSVSSLWPLIEARDQNVVIDSIKPGDYVYIIPLFHTGNTDFKPSPIGLIPGAFAHLSVLNSYLEKSPLHYLEIEPILIVGFAVAIAYLGWWMNPATLVLTLIGMTFVWMTSCLMGFVYKGMVIPFLLPQLSIMGVGITLLLQRIYIAERKARMIRSALEGVVRPEALKALQRNPEKLSLDARERVITVVFIDIVGFSLMVENQLPRVAFEGLQSLVETMTAAIHKHGGIVNKTLGDGLLCFFGYSLEENKEVGMHAENALAATLEIQSMNIQRILAVEGKREPVFPLRIGINTSAVFMGNLGAGERLDITVIGNGVNFAKRLEAACIPNAVLVGSTTYDLVRHMSVYGEAVKRSIHIKHHDEEMESWEFDPMVREPALRARVDLIHQLSTDAHRRKKLWNMDTGSKVGITSKYGMGHLTQVSIHGLRFDLDAMIVRGTVFEAQIDSVDGKLQEFFADNGLRIVRLEVLLVEIVESRYLHTVRFVDLKPEEVALIHQILEPFSSSLSPSSSSSLSAAG